MKKIALFLSGAAILLLAATSYSAPHAALLSKDYVECTNIADKQGAKMSDVMYLGVFYGCMSQRGYDVNSLL